MAILHSLICLGATSPISVHSSQVTRSDTVPPHAPSTWSNDATCNFSLHWKPLVYQEVRFTLALPHEINKYKYVMSWPFCSTYSACFNSISRSSSGSECINTKIKMPFCPRAWHLVRQGSTLAAQHQAVSAEAASMAPGWMLWLPLGLFKRPEHRPASMAQMLGFSHESFCGRNCLTKEGGLECYFLYGKQFTLSLILQAFFSEEKKSLFYFKIFSMVYSEI